MIDWLTWSAKSDNVKELKKRRGEERKKWRELANSGSGSGKKAERGSRDKGKWGVCRVGMERKDRRRRRNRIIYSRRQPSVEKEKKKKMGDCDDDRLMARYETSNQCLKNIIAIYSHFFCFFILSSTFTFTFAFVSGFWVFSSVIWSN